MHGFVKMHDTRNRVQKKRKPISIITSINSGYYTYMYFMLDYYVNNSYL